MLNLSSSKQFQSNMPFVFNSSFSFSLWQRSGPGNLLPVGLEGNPRFLYQWHHAINHPENSILALDVGIYLVLCSVRLGIDALQIKKDVYTSMNCDTNSANVMVANELDIKDNNTEVTSARRQNRKTQAFFSPMETLIQQQSMDQFPLWEIKKKKFWRLLHLREVQNQLHPSW